MIDTLKMMTKANLSREQFHEERITTAGGRTSVRWIRNDDQIGCTYYPASATLFVEVSLLKFVGDGFANLSARENHFVLQRVEHRLAQWFGVGDVFSWEVYRIDYGVNLEVGDRVQSYITALQNVWLNRHVQARFGTTGVNWRSNKRWVKFYDKGTQMGDPSRGVLRYEVSTLRRGLDHLAQAVGVDVLRVRDVVDDWLVLYVLVFWLHALGLAGELSSDALLLPRLHELYGTQMSTALLVLRLVDEYGAAAYKPPFNYVSSATYYRYRASLVKHGLLCEDRIALNLCESVLVLVVREIATNLEKNFRPRRAAVKHTDQNFSPKIFPQKFGGASDLELLEVSLERVWFMDAKEEGN